MTSITPDISPEQVWNRPRWQEYRDSFSLSRREDDARQLSRLFNAAAKSPTCQAALDWAAAQGIEIVVDRGLRGINGGYHTGAGVLSLSDGLLGAEQLEQAISTLTHELRHAWQDRHGMGEGMEGKGAHNFAQAFMLNALIEADATAFGALARTEYRLACDIERLRANVAEGKPAAGLLADAEAGLKEATDDPAAVMWQAFRGWFEGNHPAGYGLMRLQQRAGELGEKSVESEVRGILGVLGDEKTEFMGFSDPKLPPLALGTPLPLDAGAKGLEVLGRDFSGAGNYLGGSDRKAYLEGKVLNADAARGFYGHVKELSGLGIDGLVKSVEKAEASAVLRAREAKDRAARDAGLEQRRLEREKNRRSRPANTRVTF